MHQAHVHHKLYKTPKQASTQAGANNAHRSIHPFLAFEYLKVPHLVHIVELIQLLVDHVRLLPPLDVRADSPI